MLKLKMKIMKRRNPTQILSLILCMAMIVSMASCGGDDDDDNDDEPQVDPLVGTYVFESATFASEITVAVLIDQTDPSSGTTDVTFMVGESGDLFVGDALVGRAPCTDTAATATQLREDGTTFFVCTGETNEARQGTWTINPDRSTLILTIFDPDPNGRDFDVIMDDFELTNNQMTGRALIPVPIDQSIKTGDPLPGGGLNFQNASMDIVFTKLVE